MPLLPLYLAGLLLLTSNAVGANFYKCENTDGKITFSDKPCPTTSTLTKKGKLHSFRISGTIGKNEFTDDQPKRDNNSIFIFRAKFSEILQSLTPLRQSITQYYMDRRHWPENLKSLGFEQKTMRSKHIDLVKIMANGKIVATLNPGLGNDKYIILAPKPAMGDTIIDWQCWSNFPRLLLGYSETEACESRQIF